MVTDGFTGKAVVCGAAVLVASHLVGMQGGAGQAPASLEVRELVLLGEDGSRAATLGLRDGSVVFELVGPQGARITLTAGEDETAIAILRRGEERVTLSESKGDAYVLLNSREDEELEKRADIIMFTRSNGQGALIDAEAGSSVVYMAASPTEGGFLTSFDDRVEASMVTRTAEAFLDLGMDLDEDLVDADDSDAEDERPGQVRITVAAPGVEVRGLAPEGK